MAATPKKMSNEEVETVARRMVQEASDFVKNEIAPSRDTGFKYLRGEVDLPAPPGRSAVVMTDCRDSVDLMMPQLMRMFVTSKKPVEFEPFDAASFLYAKDATQYVSYVYMRDNPGWMLTHDFIKDALEAKIGVFKAYWTEDEQVEHEEYKGLSDGELLALLGDPEVSVVSGEQVEIEDGEEEDLMDSIGESSDPDAGTEMAQPPGPAGGAPTPGGSPPPAGGPANPTAGPLPGPGASPPSLAPGPAPGPVLPPNKLFNVKIKRVRQKTRVTVECIPPEELIIDRYASTAENTTLIGQDSQMRVGDLVAMGISKEEAAAAAGPSSAEQQTQSKEIRAGYTRDVGSDDSDLDPSLQAVRVVRAWARIDADGDGLPELHRLLMAGTGPTLLKDEIVPYVPFAIASPYRKPHEAIGRSVVDLTKDIQDINTALMRQVLDNAYATNRPRRAVVEGMVNWGDLLDDAHDGLVRVKQPGMIQDLTVPFVAGQTIPIFSMIEDRKEARTGISKASAGLDPDALQSSTAIGVAATIQAAQAMIEMVGRTIGEMGFAPLFKLILRILVDHQELPRTIYIREQPFTYDPTEWSTGMDVMVNVGLGRGTEDERVRNLAAIAAKQEAILMAQGPDNPICSPANYAATLADMTELLGFENTTRYFNSPDDVHEATQRQASAPPKPDPAMAKVQGELSISQQKAADAASAKTQETQGKMAVQGQKAAAEIQNMGTKTQASIAIAAMKERNRNATANAKLVMGRNLEAMKIALTPKDPSAQGIIPNGAG